MTRRAVTIPPGTWPPRMNAAMAAGYCGEKNVEAFLERVGTEYPQPRAFKTRQRRFWYKDDLDKAIGINDDHANKASGLGAKFSAKVREQRND